MSTSCEEYYKQLHTSCGDVVAASFLADTIGLQAAGHSFIGDLEKWHGVLIHRPESDLLKASLREYQFALLAVVQGQYRQAFMALRLSFELLLGAIHLSANELELRIWLRGARDLIWNDLIDSEAGVLSKRFVGAFYEELADEAPTYRAIGQAVYRECSEYVHGNALTHSLLPGQVVFQQNVFEDWHAKAKAVRLVSSFALCARYVRFVDEAMRTALEPVLLDNLGHIPAIRVILGAPVEQEYV
jgi:hypothetical protein